MTSTIIRHVFENAEGREAELRLIRRTGTHNVYIVTEAQNGGAQARAILTETTSVGVAIEVLERTLGASLKDLLQVAGPAFQVEPMQNIRIVPPGVNIR